MGIHTVNMRLWRTINENTAANILLRAISISIAGVEFATEEDAVSYTPPEWFGEDVSERAEFCNSYLSAHCCRDITF